MAAKVLEKPGQSFCEHMATKSLDFGFDSPNRSSDRSIDEAWPVEGNLTPIWRGQSGNLARFSIWSNLARRNLAWPSQSGQTPGISDKCLRFQSDGRTNLARYTTAQEA